MLLIDISEERDDLGEVQEAILSDEVGFVDSLEVSGRASPADSDDESIWDRIQAISRKQLEVSSMVTGGGVSCLGGSNLMVQKDPKVKPWEGQGVKVIGDGVLMDYLAGEPIYPETSTDV